MKKLLFILIASIITLSSCNKIARVTDSEISAIRDQTDVLKEQNKLLEQQNVIMGEMAKTMKEQNQLIAKQ